MSSLVVKPASSITRAILDVATEFNDARYKGFGFEARTTRLDSFY